MTTSEDNPGVVAPPPLLYAAAFVIVVALRWLWPLPMRASPIPVWSGWTLAAIALATAIWGRLTLQAAGTNINPALPVTTIVTSGPYRFSRNPLYVSLTAFYLGLTLPLNTWWSVGVLVPLLIVMHFGVVRREERYLEDKFGESYRQYRSRVRRYL